MTIIQKECVFIKRFKTIQGRSRFPRQAGKNTFWLFTEYRSDRIDEYNKILQLEISKKEKPRKQSKDAMFQLPAIIKEIPHRESILRILPTAGNSFMLMGQDGLISFWSSALKFKKSRSLFLQEENRKFKWITDFTLINQYNKLMIGTCDREIRIYELSNFEPYCQIIGLDSMPLRLDYSPTGEDQCIILYGDEQGCVHIFLVSLMKECLRNWSKGPTVDGIPSVTIEKLTLGRQITYICWKVHDDWVTEVKYIRSVKAVISSCNEEETALVIDFVKIGSSMDQKTRMMSEQHLEYGQTNIAWEKVFGCVRSTKNFQQKMNEIQDAFHNRNGQPQPTVAVQQKRLSCDETVFIISKGAKTFDFCKENNLVATGGLDKIVRLWNPHLPRRPIGMLQGHSSPVIFLNIDEGTHRLFSIALDKIIKVWDIEDQICLVTVKPITSKISGDLAACYYSQELKALYLATDALALLRLQSSEEQNKGVSHNEPVLCCLYNKLMRQIVTCCEESVVKVWDLDTGSPVLEFTTAHGDAAITCMTFDISERRLITGSRDGSVKKWNYQNGQCIQTLKQVGNRTEEVTDCIYTEIFKNGYIISVGWDKRINVFPDIQDNCDTQYPLLHWEKETIIAAVLQDALKKLTKIPETALSKPTNVTS
ncbi:uncharacterized protein LOC116984909 [Amblyraja radiata]|uniref:uncharacterized protein LOC116984909 n=1 Tax=Amblyraja radiata TaxID=386614 RepID=UPI0014031FD8|nr:uncharacterized protein LOC116984909 [Amblyraja radiata]